MPTIATGGDKEAAVQVDEHPMCPTGRVDVVRLSRAGRKIGTKDDDDLRPFSRPAEDRR